MASGPYDQTGFHRFFNQTPNVLESMGLTMGFPKDTQFYNIRSDPAYVNKEYVGIIGQSFPPGIPTLENRNPVTGKIASSLPLDSPFDPNYTSTVSSRLLTLGFVVLTAGAFIL